MGIPRYTLTLVLLLAFCPIILSQQAREKGTKSTTVSQFEQKLNKRIDRFESAGKTLVASVVELAFTYQLPTAIEYANRDATVWPLDMHFHNQSIREILESLVRQVPEYGVSFSSGVVDVYENQGRENPSNLLNKTIEDFTVTQMDTHDADFQLFCDLSRALGSQACAGSIAVGQWGPLKITVRLKNAKAYEVLNAIVAENGKAMWTVVVRPDKLSALQNGGIWYVYPLQQPFKAAVAERLASLKQ
jgi:hypothetical protein